MIKNYIETKDLGLKIIVKDNSLYYYKDNELVGETWGFINKDNTKKQDGKISFKLHKHTGILEDYGWITFEEKVLEEFIKIRENIRNTIDNYFNNLDNVHLKRLSNGSIIFSNKDEEYKNLEKLSHYYFLDARDKWIKNNKKYFIEDSGWKKDNLGMMYPYTNYYFSKENIAKINKEIEEYKKTDEYKEKMRKKQESEERYSKLYELALKLNNEDFEDVTGLPREHFIN